MSTHGAAPRGGTRGGGYIDGSPTSIPESVPESIRERLAGEDVHALDDWRRLGRRRHQIWGIVPSIVRQLDELARGAS